jgi:hypothetical protein
LNYEGVRNDPDRPWRKKNLNLRFSRLATVFSTVVALLVIRPKNADEFLPLVAKTPFERLASALDQMRGENASDAFLALLDDYEWFLQLKDDKGAEVTLGDAATKQEARRRAEAVSSFFMRILASESLKANARYLML